MAADFIPGEGPEASFDPRTWTAPAAAAPAAAPAPTEAAAAPALAPARGSRRALLLGGGAAGLALAGVGGAWWALGRAPAPVSSSGEGAEAPVAQAHATASVQRQLMTLDGPGAIGQALALQGFKPEAAQGAAAAAAGALGGAPGEMRLELATLKPAPGDTAEVRLVSMTVKRPDGSGVSVTHGASGFVATPVKVSTHATIQVVQGQVDAESFYTSAVSAGLSDALIPDFFQAFVYDFDFQREIEAGAVFQAAIGETLNQDGAAVGARRLLYAAMTTAKKSVALYRFDAPDAPPGDPGWYDGGGRSIRRGLMRTPVEGARISSSFGWRVHPILGFQKLHKGTDFAAPVGTPIYASGDGVVEWAAMKGPNGNLTILQHDNGWETYYLHQNAFAPGVVPGARVRQGQNIGWVGTTGRSTGPHLHYELHIDKEAVDAMAQPLDAGKTLTGAALAAFLKQRDAIDKLRATSL